MSEWKEKKLGELGFTYTGLSGKISKDFGSGRPYIPYLNIFNNSIIDVSILDYVVINSYEKQNKVKKGDLFFTTSSETFEEVGMTSVLLDELEDCYLNSFCFGFRLHNFDDLLPEFAHYLFRSELVRKIISDLGQGSTRYNLPKTELLNRLILKFPSLPTQRKIARILSTADAVIEKTQAAIAKYKAIKQGMLHDLFTRGIDAATNKLRPTYQDAPELYKPSKLGWIPKEWEEKRLENLTDKIGSGITPTGGSEIYQSTGVLFLRSQNVLIGCLSIKDAAFITNDIDEMMRASRVMPFDVLLNITGASIGRCAYFPQELKSANVNQHVCIIRFINPSKELAIFASEFMNSDFGQSQIFRLNAGGNREGLNFQQIKSFSFPVIDSTEIRMISKIIEAISNNLQTEQTYLHKLQQIKAGLMADLLSGKKKVTGNEEPAN